MTRPRAVVSWSSGKDSALALIHAREQFEVVGLLTTTSRASSRERVAMHGVRRELLDAQARALGLQLDVVELPSPCSNDEYEQAMRGAVERMLAAGVELVVFGDLFLADVRAYRERMLADTGLRPAFPLWGRGTLAVAAEILAAGIDATLTCVDLRKLPRTLLGRRFDQALLAELPAGVDPCGEHGEFHSFVSRMPGMASEAVLADLRQGEIVEREGFAWIDLHERDA